MNIIPAIDIQNGKCVRLMQGKFDTAKQYGNPVILAKEWQNLGAKRLHIVDLDGAKNGTMKNFDVIKKIVLTIQIPIQVGGGIRDEKTIQQLFAIGVEKVILGSLLFENLTLFKTAIEKYSEKIIVAIDVKDEIVMTNGWIKNSKKNLWDLLKDLEIIGVKKIIITDIQKDGMLSSPNFSLFKKCLEFTTLPIVASGGVSSKKDIEELENIGMNEVIVGKALYERKIDL